MFSGVINVTFCNKKPGNYKITTWYLVGNDLIHDICFDKL